MPGTRSPRPPSLGSDRDSDGPDTGTDDDDLDDDDGVDLSRRLDEEIRFASGGRRRSGPTRGTSIYLDSLRGPTAVDPEVDDAVKTLSKVSRTPGTLSEAQDTALRVLQMLVDYTDLPTSSWRSAPQLPAVVQAGGIPAVVSCLNSTSAEPVVELCLQLLRHLSRASSNKQEIAQGPGSPLATVINAMSRYRGSLKIQEHGCCLLGNVSMLEDNHKVVTDARAFDVLVGAMVTHPSEVAIQQYCCLAFRHLLRRSESVPHLLVGVGDAAGVPRVVAAMTAHPSCEPIQHYGSNILSLLASWSSSSGVIRSATDALISANAAAALMTALQHHPRHEDVCREAGVALQVLFSSPRGRAQIAAVPDALKTLAAVLRHQHNNSAVQDAVGSVFHDMALGLPATAESRALLAACGYSPSIIETMRASLRDAEVQLWGTQVLMDLGFHGVRRAQIGRCNGLAVLLEVLQEHGTHEDIVERALGALWVLCFNQENKGMLTSLDGAVGLLASTQSAYSNPRILERASGLMFLLQLS